MKFNKLLMLDYDKASFGSAQWQRLKALSKEQVLLPTDDPSLQSHLQTADCLLVKLGAKVNKTLIDKMPSLRYIGILGTGYGRIDSSYAASKGIAVCNIAGYSTESVSEFVFALILEHLRELSRAKAQAAKGLFSEKGFSASELKGKKFGIIGLGRIGSRTAEIASSGFGAEVHYWSRQRKGAYEQKGIVYQALEPLLEGSDLISIHLELNKGTERILDAEKIKKIKPGALVLNLSPMELIDIKALAARLEKGDLFFITDHADELDLEEAKLLSSFPTCTLYPAIGYISKEATQAKMGMFVDNLENFLKGKPTNKVN